MKKEIAHQIIQEIKTAQKLGREAGEKQYQILFGQGEQYTVFVNDKPSGGMLDLCGFSMMTVPGNGKIVRALKLLGEAEENDHYKIGEDILIYKNDRGYALLLWLTSRQEISVNDKATKAATKYLNSKELECTCRTVID